MRRRYNALTRVTMLGMMYASMPFGAMVGAITSGWVKRIARPWRLLIVSTLAAFMLIMSLGLVSHLLSALRVLTCFGYCAAIASLLQFILIQQQTPDSMLGRVNSLVIAQSISGDSFGALGIGTLGKLVMPLLNILWFGGIIAGIMLVIALTARSLRHARFITLQPASVKPEEKTRRVEEDN